MSRIIRIFNINDRLISYSESYGDSLTIWGQKRPPYIPPRITTMEDGSREIFSGNSGEKLLRIYPDGRVYDYLFSRFLSAEEAEERLEDI